MATYKVTDPTTGKAVSLTGDSPPTEDELNNIFATVHGQQPSDQTSQPNTSMSDVALMAAKAPFAQPIQAMQFGLQNPEKLTGALPVAGAVGGEMMAGPAGASVGAGLGQIGKRMADIGLGNVQPGDAMNPAKEAVAPMAQSVLAGLPGTTEGKAAIQSIGKGLAKAGQTLSGVKQDVLQQAARQGYSTYGAPSLPKAQEIFGQALGPEGRAAMQQPATEAFDASLGKARETATNVGTKLEQFLGGSGTPPTEIEALQARQATDRIISATPVTDKMTRSALFDWRTKFDSLMSAQSGKLADASSTYRQAIVKDKLLNLTRLTKSGEPSAFLPLVLGAGARGVEGGIGVMTGTSPAVWGLGATTAGQIAKTPTPIRQAVISAVVDRFVH